MRNEVAQSAFDAAERQRELAETNRSRRTDIIRFCLFIIVVLFLFNADEPRGNERGNQNSQPLHTVAMKRIFLNQHELADLKTVFPVDQRSTQLLNVTGMYGGSWKPGLTSKHIVHNSSSGTSPGNMLLQLETVPVQGLPQISFVFGVLRLYRRAAFSEIKLLTPLQGVLLAYDHRLILYSTPFRGQGLALKIQKLSSPPLDGFLVTHNTSHALRLAVSRETNISCNGSASCGASEWEILLGDHLLPERYRALQHAFRPRNESFLLSADPPSMVETCQYLLDVLVSVPKDNDEKKVDSVERIHGSISSPWPCSSTVTIEASSLSVKLARLQRKVDIYSLVVFFLSLIQITLFIFLLRHLATPAVAAGVSIAGVLAQALLDAVLCVGHLLMSAALPNIFFGSFIWISVVKLVSFSVFQMRMAILIYQARYSQEISSEGWQGLRARLVNLHLLFYTVVILTLFVMFFSLARPVIIILLLYSFWWPQILFSAFNGSKPQLPWFILFGTCISQLFLPLYFLGCPDNFFVLMWESFNVGVSTSPYASINACYFLVFWLTLQVLILILQSIYGPRFFLPKHLRPQYYDYRRPIPGSLLNHPHNELLHHASSSDVEIGRSGENSSRIECVICYNPVLDYQHHYLITPCDHLFHEECLREWAKIKMECPICRAALPPIDPE